jgi:NAD(P)-dependent dehydrogenase (short-subunit alcohol dehydrogenase family)
MITTEQVSEKNNKDQTKYLSGSDWKGKVALLVGNDGYVLQSLAREFASKGVDVALVTTRLSPDISSYIGDGVLSFGSRFFLVDTDLNAFQKAEAIMRKVKMELGRIDFVIDLSSGKDSLSPVGHGAGAARPFGWLSDAVIDDVVRK